MAARDDVAVDNLGKGSRGVLRATPPAPRLGTHPSFTKFRSTFVHAWLLAWSCRRSVIEWMSIGFAIFHGVSNESADILVWKDVRLVLRHENVTQLR